MYDYKLKCPRLPLNLTNENRNFRSLKTLSYLDGKVRGSCDHNLGLVDVRKHCHKNEEQTKDQILDSP